MNKKIAMLFKKDAFYRFHIYFLIFLILFVTSCGTAIRPLMGLKNPKVYSAVEIDSFTQKLEKADNVYDAKYVRVDSSEIFNTVMKSLGDVNIYNAQHKVLCNSDNDIGCNYLSQLEIESNSISNVFRECTFLDQAPMLAYSNLNDVLKDLNVENQEKFINHKTDYTIVYYWSYKMQKGKHENDWKSIAKSFENEKNVKFLRINTDLNQDWGLEKGDKMKLKLKKRKGFEFEIIPKKIPFKKA